MMGPVRFEQADFGPKGTRGARRRNGLVRPRAAAYEAVHLPTAADADAALREERRRIARELHDSAAQLLAATLTHLQGAEEMIGRRDGAAPGAARERVALAAALIREGLSELRRTVGALRVEPCAAGLSISAAVGDADLSGALERAVRVLTAGVPFLAVRVRMEGMRRPLPASSEAELLRIAQEAVANVVKHSGAHRAEVVLAFGAGGRVRLEVSDDGRGFDPAAVVAGAATGRYGLVGMGERAARLGARLSIESRTGGGTHVTVLVPAPREERRPTLPNVAGPDGHVPAA